MNGGRAVKLNLRVLSIAVMVATGMIGAVQVAGPESLGVSAVAIRWLGIVAAGLAIVQGFLPKVQGPTTDPAEIADRVWNLSDEDRAKVIDEVEQRRREQRILDTAAEVSARMRARDVDPTTPAGRGALDRFEEGG